MIVKAAVARHAGSSLAIESLTLDEPRAGELLVRLIASGVAQSDLDAIATGQPIGFPLVAGGEGAGIVERIGDDVEGFAPGDPVILTAASCGHCPQCNGGSPALCVERDALNRSGTREDGSRPFVADAALLADAAFLSDADVAGFFQGQSSFATHVLCRFSAAAKVKIDTPLEVLACLGGEVQIAASAILHGFPIEDGDSIVIAGAGVAGLVATMAAKTLGANTIIVADPDEKARTLASALGATITIHTDNDLAAVVKSLTGSGAKFALETTGHEVAIAACLESLAPGGSLGLMQASTAPAASVDALSSDSRQLIDCSRGFGAPHDVIDTLVAWHAEGRFPIDRLVAFFPFEHIIDALQALATGVVVKPVVRFSLGAFGDLDRADVEGATAEGPAPPSDEETTDKPEPVIATVEAG